MSQQRGFLKKAQTSTVVLAKYTSSISVTDIRKKIVNLEYVMSSSNRKNITTTRAEILEAIDYMQANIAEQLSLEKVADHVFLSQFYFSKLFKKELGTSFINYLNNLRIEQAIILLEDFDLSVEDVSQLVGFQQTSYFCKVFRQITAYTPGKYRKLFLKNYEIEAFG